MRKSKFTDSQIVDAVKRVEAGFAVPDICRELGVSTGPIKSRAPAKHPFDTAASIKKRHTNHQLLKLLTLARFHALSRPRAGHW
jgi:hypothetical protein